MGADSAMLLAALACLPSWFVIRSAMKSNARRIARSRGVNTILVLSVLGGLLVGGYLLFLAAVILQIKTFVTFAVGIFFIALSAMPFLIAYLAWRALNGAEMRTNIELR